jgi:hypothetical protein
MMVGEIIIPNELLAIHNELNKVILERRLNEADVFDTELRFKPKDVLQVVLNNSHCYDRLVYTFKYMSKKWQEVAIDPFSLSGHYDEIEFGKLKG